MSPIIRNALLKEALATSTEKAMANFIAAMHILKNRPPARMLKHEGFERFMLTEEGNSRIRSLTMLHCPSVNVLANKSL